MTDILSDGALYDAIKAGGIHRKKAITYIYQDKKIKNQVVAFVSNNRGNREDGIDVFHEGIIALDENIRNDKFAGTGKLKAYLFAICRFIWFNKLKRNKRIVLTSETTAFEQISLQTPESISLDKEQEIILDQLLSRLGDKCKKILELWKLSYSMEEIAVQVELKNAGVARRQKYNCYEKLLEMIDREPAIKNMLK